MLRQFCRLEHDNLQLNQSDQNDSAGGMHKMEEQFRAVLSHSWPLHFIDSILLELITILSRSGCFFLFPMMRAEFCHVDSLFGGSILIR